MSGYYHPLAGGRRSLDGVNWPSNVKALHGERRKSQTYKVRSVAIDMLLGLLDRSKGVFLDGRQPLSQLFQSIFAGCDLPGTISTASDLCSHRVVKQFSCSTLTPSQMTTSAAVDPDMPQRCPSTPKSAKRKAAEALLAARYSEASSSTSTFASGPVHEAIKRHCSHIPSLPKPVVVAACPSSCGVAGHKHHGWCHNQVTLSHLNWRAVFENASPQMVAVRLGEGYNRLYMAGTSLQVLVVENAMHVEAAVKQLRASMQDPVLAVDLEWRPDFSGRFSPVAMVQLASSTCALLLRTSRMQFQLPPVVQELLSDPAVQVVGFAWESSDEAKMSRTFGFGRGKFGCFQDLQEVAEGMGYHSYGLARLAKQILGFDMPKSKRVSMSNWEATVLSSAQIKYAALDVFAAGLVYRGLRVWHAEPTPCSKCRQMLGEVPGPVTFHCGGNDAGPCSKKYHSWAAYQGHCLSTQHQNLYNVCTACGRVHAKTPVQKAIPQQTVQSSE